MDGISIHTNNLTEYRNAGSAGKTNNIQYSFHSAMVREANKAGSSKNVQTESAVNDYIKRHPEHAAHVNSQVNAGKSVIAMNGVQDISREDMTMAEYQEFFMGLMHTIPYDSTQLNDTSVLSISDKGWEQMKKDPDYEAWILGYTVEDRSVRIPFANWPGASGRFSSEHFGASIEEHHGESMPSGNTKEKRTNKEDEETWWQKRHKQFEELIAEQVMKAQKEALAERSALQQEYWMGRASASYDHTITAFSENIAESSIPIGNSK